jgi:sporulation protein YlmC with PRC-barrel domain
MGTRNINVELLLDKEVKDSEGRSAGRIEEIRARREGEEIAVEAYHLGPEALLERLAAPVMRLSLMRALGFHRHSLSLRVPWDQLDLSDPEKPVLRCPREELVKLAR